MDSLQVYLSAMIPWLVNTVSCSPAARAACDNCLRYRLRSKDFCCWTDEATSTLDTQSEGIVQDTLDKAAAGEASASFRSP